MAEEIQDLQIKLSADASSAAISISKLASSLKAIQDALKTVGGQSDAARTFAVLGEGAKKIGSDAGFAKASKSIAQMGKGMKSLVSAVKDFNGIEISTGKFEHLGGTLDDLANTIDGEAVARIGRGMKQLSDAVKNLNSLTINTDKFTGLRDAMQELVSSSDMTATSQSMALMGKGMKQLSAAVATINGLNINPGSFAGLSEAIKGVVTTVDGPTMTATSQNLAMMGKGVKSFSDAAATINGLNLNTGNFSALRDSITEVISSVDNLKSSTVDAVKGFSGLANAAKNINNAQLNKDSFTGVAESLSGLVDSVDDANKIGASIKTFAQGLNALRRATANGQDIGANLASIVSGVKSGIDLMDDNALDKLDKYASAVERLKRAGSMRLPQSLAKMDQTIGQAKLEAIRDKEQGILHFKGIAKGKYSATRKKPVAPPAPAPEAPVRTTSYEEEEYERYRRAEAELDEINERMAKRQRLRRPKAPEYDYAYEPAEPGDEFLGRPVSMWYWDPEKAYDAEGNLTRNPIFKGDETKHELKILAEMKKGQEGMAPAAKEVSQSVQATAEAYRKLNDAVNEMNTAPADQLEKKIKEVEKAARSLKKNLEMAEKEPVVVPLGTSPKEYRAKLAREAKLMSEQPRPEAPKPEIPKAEPVKAEIPKPVKVPKVKAEKPVKVEVPKPEPVKVEVPKVEAPKVEVPKPAKPLKVEAPKPPKVVAEKPIRAPKPPKVEKTRFEKTVAPKIAEESVKAAPKVDTATKSVEGLKKSLKDVPKAARGISSISKESSRATGPLGKLGNMFKRVLLYRGIRAVITGLTQAIGEGVTNLYNWSSKASGNGAMFAKQMDSMSSSLLTLKNSVGAAVSPLIMSLIPVLNQVASAAIVVVNAINQLFAALSGQSFWYKAKDAVTKFGSAVGGAGGAVKDLLADWDELNIIQQEGGGGGGGSSGGIGGEFETAELSDWAKWIQEHLEEIKKLAAAVGAAILGWKLATGFMNGIQSLINGINAIKDFFHPKNKLQMPDLDASELSNAVDEMKKSIESIPESLKEIPETLNKIPEALRELKKELPDLLKGLEELKLPNFGDLGLGDLTSILGLLKTIFGSLLVGLLSGLSLNGAKKDAEAIKDALEKAKKAVEDANKAAKELADNLKNATSPAEAIKSALESVTSSIDAIRAKFVGISDAIVAQFRTGTNYAKNFLDSLSAYTKNLFVKDINALFKKVEISEPFRIEIEGTRNFLTSLAVHAKNIVNEINSSFKGIDILGPIRTAVDYSKNFLASLEAYARNITVVGISNAFGLLQIAAPFKLGWEQAAPYLDALRNYVVSATVPAIANSFGVIASRISAPFASGVTSATNYLMQLISYVREAVNAINAEMENLKTDYTINVNMRTSSSGTRVTGTPANGGGTGSWGGLSNDYLGGTSRGGGGGTNGSGNFARTAYNSATSLYSAVDNVRNVAVKAVKDLTSASLLGQVAKKLTLDSKSGLSFRAAGGLPATGELYIARESGPELVGRLGGKSNAVVNNEQLVAGVARGLEHTNDREVELLSQIVALQRRLVDKELTIRPTAALGRVVQMSTDMYGRTVG